MCLTHTHESKVAFTQNHIQGVQRSKDNPKIAFNPYPAPFGWDKLFLQIVFSIYGPFPKMSLAR